MFIKLQCVDCSDVVVEGQDFWQCRGCGKKYSWNDKTLVCWPTEMSEFSREEVEYHDELNEDAKNLHQLNSWRNLFYHSVLWNTVKTLPKESFLLEIGAGSGFDTKEFVNDYKLVVSDISPETVNRLAKILGSDKPDYIAADAQYLPFVSDQFDCVYMLATWHHVEKPKSVIDEAGRVLKKDGILFIGIEPNAFYFRTIKFFRNILLKLTHMKGVEVSKADAEMIGFTFGQIKKHFDSEKWGDVQIRPMWFLAGWLHYFSEFLFRSFRLKKRIKWPMWFEKILVGLDELLFKVPGFKHLCWHWIVTSRKD